MSRKERILRAALASLFAFLGVWLCLSLFSRSSHEGMLFLIPIAGCFALAAFPRFYNFVFKRRKALAAVSIALVVLFCLFIGAAAGLMVYGAGQPVLDNAGTIIVLGCLVVGEEPGSMLARRADAALAYWRAHPNCDIIVTGGTGRYATISEAEALRRYLVQNGVDDARIYVEDRSANTEENLRFSAEIIARYGLSENAVIVTDRFHQYRASVFAQKYGLSSSPVSCSTAFYLSLGCWCREILAVARVLILGY